MTNSPYMQVGKQAKNKLFGISPIRRLSRVTSNRHSNGRPFQMLVSNKITLSNSRLAVIVVGIFTLAIGIILSSIPWLDYIIMKNLKILNGTLSYHYWHKPGVLRLTKVFIFNVTNPEAFLNNGEKPNLQEIGPFVYREDMEKVNTKFYENGTVSFQHHKILHFMPEKSIAGADDLQFTVPNIPLLSLTTMANNLKPLIRTGLNLFLRMMSPTPFKTLTIHEFVSGYDDTLTSLGNTYFPKNNRPPAQMGLFLNRNGTLTDEATIFNGDKGWENFGYMDRLNGLDHLPYWNAPCNSISASEGSLFPPKEITKADTEYLWDKDLCRTWPMKYRYDTVKKGISAGYYTPADDIFDYTNDSCYCGGVECPLNGLSSISPCQYNAPLYLSFPHFLNADPKLLDAVTGLEPSIDKHESFVKINAKIGVPIEARIKVQLNIMVEQSNIHVVRQFPNIVFPVLWLEEGVEELPRHLQVLVYLSTTFADEIVPYLTYGMIVFGALVLVVVFLQAYRKEIFNRENVELGKNTLRRGSSLFIRGQHKLMVVRDSYRLLPNPLQDTETEPDSST